MTQSTTAHTAAEDSTKAGDDIAAQIRAGLGGMPPDVIIVFASSRHNYAALLGRINEVCRPKAIVGSSSAGEFTESAFAEGSISAVALRSDEMQFNVVATRGLRERPLVAANEMAAQFTGLHKHDYAYRSALIMTDALAGHADTFVEQLTLATGGRYQLFGGGAGDDARFSRTHVFYGTEAANDAVVALEILSHRPIGIGVHHGWETGSRPLRVTEAEGMRVISLNSAPAVEAFEEYAEQTGQKFDRTAPMSFFLHNVLGVATPTGHLLRVPLAVMEDGSVQCAAELPVGSTAHIMVPSALSALSATRNAVQQLKGEEAGTALFFDCVATRLRMGKDFGFELEAIKEAIGSANYAGCNTYGQIARAEGQFSGFHNCTAVVAVIPK